jgi:hypothetical protein
VRQQSGGRAGAGATGDGRAGKLHGNAMEAEQRGALANDRAATAGKQATRDTARAPCRHTMGGGQSATAWGEVERGRAGPRQGDGRSGRGSWAGPSSLTSLAADKVS